MIQDLHQVELFENQVEHALELQDYEFGCRDRDPEIDMPLSLSETYLRRVVSSRGVPSIRRLTEWSVQTLGRKLPTETLTQLHLAHEALRHSTETDTYDALELAALATVSDLKYDDLNLAEAAASACLVYTLATVADHVVAGMSCELTTRTNLITPDERVWTLISGEGAPTDLVDMLARFFWLHRETLSEPKMVTVERLRAQIVPSRHNGDMPGFVVALWAATNGHLITLSNEILAGLEARATAYELRRPSIEKELGLH